MGYWAKRTASDAVGLAGGILLADAVHNHPEGAKKVGKVIGIGVLAILVLGIGFIATIVSSGNNDTVATDSSVVSDQSYLYDTGESDNYDLQSDFQQDSATVVPSVPDSDTSVPPQSDFPHIDVENVRPISPLPNADGIAAGVLPESDSEFGCYVTFGTAENTGINIWENHSEGSQLLTTVPAGEIFEYEECPNTGWVRAAYMNSVGWAYNGSQPD